VVVFAVVELVLLPFLAWYLDRQRKSRIRKQSRL
jgi:hypothetical protein